NRKVASVPHGAEAEVPLDGTCYVFSTARAKLKPHGEDFAYCPVISPAKGALFQSQFYAELQPGNSPVVSADGRETVLFVTHGEGEVEIGGRRFAFTQRSGIYVRPDEAWRVHATAPV